MLILWLPCSTSATDTRNNPEIRLGRDDKPEGMSDNLRTDFVRITLEKISDVYMIWNFPSTGSEYSRTILQILLISPDVNARPGEVTFRPRGKNLEQVARGNALSEAYMATPTQLKARKGNLNDGDLKVLGLGRWLWEEELACPSSGNKTCISGSGKLSCAKDTPIISFGSRQGRGVLPTVPPVHFTLQEHLSGKCRILRIRLVPRLP